PAHTEEPAKTYKAEEVRNVAYYDGKDADAVRHKLDVYVPKDQKDCPVVLFIHGGAWVFGDKNFLGLHASFRLFLASPGIVAVVPNYRLSPGINHAEHIRDVARALACRHKNIGKHGGRSDRMFVSGHSAGGHLAALLGTDPSYLKDDGLTLDSIKGIVGLSG